MARSRNVKTAGNVLQRVGRALSGGQSTGRSRGRRTRNSAPRGRRKPTSGKGLLRRLLG